MTYSYCITEEGDRSVEDQIGNGHVYIVRHGRFPFRGPNSFHVGTVARRLRGLAMAQRIFHHYTLQFSRVSFSYDGSSPVFSDVSFSLGPGWSGVVGANGSGKSTLLALAARILQPNSGTVSGPSDRFVCAQPTEKAPDRIEDFFNAFDERSIDLMRRLELEFEWLYRWQTLSDGERKRVQIAVALWLAPDLLALDEPTNHIDADAKDLVLDAIARYDGIGLLVSHDREFLDSVCARCVFLRAGTATVRPGGITAGLEQAGREKIAAERALDDARRRTASLESETVNRREIARSQQRRRSKAGLAIKDHDARFKRNLARYTGKDGTGGKLLRQLDGRLAAAHAELDTKEAEAAAARSGDPSGVSLSGTTSRADSIFRLGAGEILIGDRVVRCPELSVSRRDRVVLLGPNGSGKTTLIKRIAATLPEPKAETPFVRGTVVFLPQELDAAERRSVRAWLDSLPNADRAVVFSGVHRLGSDPERLLESPFPSPGEARKTIIASAELVNSTMLVLDEPTNHLDLPSIILLEAALAAFEGAVLFTSHDERFVETVAAGGARWILEPTPDGSVLTVL